MVEQNLQPSFCLQILFTIQFILAYRYEQGKWLQQQQF